MPSLVSMPGEVLDKILEYVEPEDLGRVAQTCTRLDNAVANNILLWKGAYLKRFDTPPQGSINWEQCLKDAMRLKFICSKTTTEEKVDHLGFVHGVVVELLNNAAVANPAAAGGEHDDGGEEIQTRSRNADFLERLFVSDSNRAAFLCQSLVFKLVRCSIRYEDALTLSTLRHEPDITDYGATPEYQMSAHLHCLYGVSQAYFQWVMPAYSGRVVPAACRLVYNVSKHNNKNIGGPFLEDGSMHVDWEKLEAIMMAMTDVMGGYHSTTHLVFRLFRPFGAHWPRSLNYIDDNKVQCEPDPLSLQDPYGVTGIWFRATGSMAYQNDPWFSLDALGFEPFGHTPMTNSYQNISRMVMRLTVTQVTHPPPEAAQQMPVVKFAGTVRYPGRPLINRIKGIVRMTPDGEVRWTFVIRVRHSTERWRSESIQIDGINSGKVVLGFWSDNLPYEQRKLTGPSAFWKVSKHNYAQPCKAVDDFVNDFIGVLETDDMMQDELHFHQLGLYESGSANAGAHTHG